MKKYLGILVSFLFAISFLSSCEKDTSAESYTPPAVVISPSVPVAKGSLQDNAGYCSNITVHGSYVKGVALNSTNYITATVSFTEAGKYKVYTNTVNGCWFSTDSMVTSGTGLQTITLKGNGTPISADTSTITLTYLTSTCSFSLITSPAPHVSSETDYFPMTNGSYIIYKRDTIENRYSMTPLKFSFNGLTETINGKVFKLATSDQHDTRYYRKDGLGHYYEYARTSSSPLPDLEYMMLDETKSVGQSWQTDTIYTKYENVDLKLVLRCTILAKNVAFNYYTPSLDSTIEVEERILARDYQNNDYSSFIQPTLAYYTKKVGLVEFDAPNYKTYLRIKEWYIQ